MHLHPTTLRYCPPHYGKGLLRKESAALSDTTGRASYPSHKPLGLYRSHLLLRDSLLPDINRGNEGGGILKRTALVLAVVVALLVPVEAAAFASGKAGNPGGDIGVGPTKLLADGTIEPDLA